MHGKIKRRAVRERESESASTEHFLKDVWVISKAKLHSWGSNPIDAAEQLN